MFPGRWLSDKEFKWRCHGIWRLPPDEFMRRYRKLVEVGHNVPLEA
jgi:hypothetical protein